MEYGVRVRSRFKTAIERQVGEAVAIHREKEKGTVLLNSKSEYNRCKIQRLETRIEKETWKDELIESEKDLKFEAGLYELRNSKKRTRKEKKLVQQSEKVSLKNVCIDIGNENVIEWHKRRKLELNKRENEDIEATKDLEKMRKKNKRDFVKKKTVSILKKKGLIEAEKLSEMEIKKRQGYWRDFRNSEIEDFQDQTIGPNFMDNVKSGKNSPKKVISEIGQRVKFRLKEPILKEKISDLAKKD